MKSVLKVILSVFPIAFSSLLLAQSTQHFKVTVSFDPDYADPVLVKLNCDGGTPLEQSFLVSEASGVTFTVNDFQPTYSCTLAQEPVEGYDTAYSANGALSAEACVFSGAGLVVDNLCVITNTETSPGYSSVVFEVKLKFSDENPVAVETEIDCTSELSLATIDAMASAESPAKYEVTWSKATPAFCTVKQVVVPAGYNRSETDCLEVSMTLDPKPECTLKNYQRGVPVRVAAPFLDGSPAEVQVDLRCDAGLVSVGHDMASDDVEATFRVLGFPYDGAICKASTEAPPGYQLVESNCGDLLVTPAAKPACALVFQPLAPVLPDPAAMTGSWFAPERSGEGFMIHRVHEDLAVGYFYGFDDKGGRLWLIGVSEGPFGWGEPVLFEAQSAMGGGFSDFDPDKVIRREWGMFTFTQWDCDRATVQMLGADGEKRVHVIRLAATSGMACSGSLPPAPLDAVTGSWFDSSTSGQGFSIHRIAPDRGMVYFYGSGDQGDTLWLNGVWESAWTAGETWTMELISADGGTFDVIDPDLILRETWGTATFRFDDCTTGWVRLEGSDGMQELDLVLLAGSLGLECESTPD